MVSDGVVYSALPRTFRSIGHGRDAFGAGADDQRICLLPAPCLSRCCAPLNPSADTALPLYVQEPGARVTKSGETLIVEAEAGKTEVAIGDVSELVLHGPVTVTTPALGALLREEIPITFASTGGWVLGHTVSTGHRNVAIRIAQSRAAFDERRSLAFARGLVAAKIRNCRVFLRRNFKAGDETERDATLEAL